MRVDSEIEPSAIRGCHGNPSFLSFPIRSASPTTPPSTGSKATASNHRPNFPLFLSSSPPSFLGGRHRILQRATATSATALSLHKPTAGGARTDEGEKRRRLCCKAGALLCSLLSLPRLLHLAFPSLPFPRAPFDFRFPPGENCSGGGSASSSWRPASGPERSSPPDMAEVPVSCSSDYHPFYFFISSLVYTSSTT